MNIPTFFLFFALVLLVAAVVILVAREKAQPTLKCVSLPPLTRAPGRAAPRYRVLLFGRGGDCLAFDACDYLDSKDGSVFALRDGDTKYVPINGTFILQDLETTLRDSDNSQTRYRISLMLDGKAVRRWVTDRYFQRGNLYSILPLYSGSTVIVRGHCEVEEVHPVMPRWKGPTGN